MGGSAVPETTHVQRRSNRAPSGVSAAEGGHSPGITDAGSGKQEYGKLPASAGSQEGARSRLPSTPSQPQEGPSALPRKCTAFRQNPRLRRRTVFQHIQVTPVHPRVHVFLIFSTHFNIIFSLPTFSF